MTEWKKIGKTHSLKTRDNTYGEPVPCGRTECDGHPIALFQLKGRIYALDDICSHEYARLSEGEVWGEDVYCPKHGSRFNIKTGGVAGLPAAKDVKSYTVKVENDNIYIQWRN